MIVRGEFDVVQQKQHERGNKQTKLCYFHVCLKQKTALRHHSVASLFIFTVLKWHLVFIRALNVFVLRDVSCTRRFEEKKKRKVTANEIVEEFIRSLFLCGFRDMNFWT
jgi:hypothetical protein